MNRLDINKEIVKMTDSTNEINIEGYRAILKHFYLNKESQKRILNNLVEEKRTDEENYLDNYFELNHQRRAFFDLNAKDDMDLGYKRYKEVLTIYPKIRADFNLVDYNIYKAGKIVVNGQPQKLFKFLLKSGVSNSHIEYITSAKASEKSLLCISRNPIDYLFNATNQHFTSCMDLHSSYEGAFYMGMGGAILDPNRFMVFLTNGKLRKHILQDVEFKHFAYINRSWGLILTENEVDLLTFIRWYPNKPFDIEKMFSKELKYNAVFLNNILDCSTPIISKFSYKLPKFQNNKLAHVYCDYLGYEYDGSTIRYKNYGVDIIGSCMDWVSFNRGFNALKKFEDLEYSYDYYCDNCNIGINSDYAYEFDGLIFCESCLGTRAFFCLNCDHIFPLADKVSTNRGSYCKSCHEKIFIPCSKCNDLLHNKNDEIYYKYGDYTKKEVPYCRNCQQDIRDKENIKKGWRCYCDRRIYNLIDGIYEIQKIKSKTYLTADSLLGNWGVTQAAPHPIRAVERAFQETLDRLGADRIEEAVGDAPTEEQIVVNNNNNEWAVIGDIGDWVIGEDTH